MENVKGMLSAKINNKPIFDDIQRDLANPCEATKAEPEEGREGFRYKIFSLTLPPSNDRKDPKEYIIHSENFGVPQRRHRVILLGLREDIASKIKELPLLTPSAHKVQTKSILDDLPKLRSGLSKVENSNSRWLSNLVSINPTILSDLRESNLSLISDYIESLKKKFSSFPDEQGKLHGLKKKKALTLNNSLELKDWYIDKRLDNYVTNHETRGHLESDLHRYLFCSSWAVVAKKNSWETKFPKSKDYPGTLKPKHKNFDSGKFSDRFRVQVSDEPATTITSHISKDGHYFIHYDPLQCRSLTVREAARVQTFPDNYFFVGNRTQQYVQVGNAVPPFLAKQISEIVHKILVST